MTDSVPKFGKEVGLQSETETCNIHIRCACHTGNYVSSEEMGNQSWNCWHCDSQIASIIGKRYSYKNEQGDELPSYCRVYNMVNIKVESER